jgi:tagatose-6-phosphate ketose/aldose isomerase
MNSDSLENSSENSIDPSAHHTIKEITGQPALWQDIGSGRDWQKDIRAFLNPLLQLNDLQIILTGAGSSAFVGDAIEPYIARSFQKSVRALPTTMLVTHFTHYVDVRKPTLFISFARSGNSPESTAVMDLAEKHCPQPYHITVTCNPNGALARKTKALKNATSVILPPQAEDQSLAMTGSFTGMILTGLLIADSLKPSVDSKHVKGLVEAGQSLLDQHSEIFRKVSKGSFERIIFLGSGPLNAMAKESHLKVQELTDGEVVGKYDSFLGFRHGPKAVSNSRTLIVCLFSSDDDVFRYEKDLAEDLLKNNYAGKVIGLFARPEQANNLSFEDQHEQIVLDLDASLAESGFEILPYVMPAQLIGYYKSLELGLNPDNPSRTGAISRVVQGVRIYETPPKE